MQTDKQKFKDYVSWLIKDNKLDKNKLADLRKNSQTAFKEWQATKSIWTNYLINQPKITKSKIDTPKEDVIPGNNESPTWELWQTSASNTMTEKLEDSIWAYDKKVTDAASEKETVLKENATEKTDIIKERDLWKRERTDEESELAKKKFDMEEDNAARAREDADAVFKRQEDIANRQAQIAWAWLERWFSEADMQSFKDDIIAKYWENISNAEQFKAKTNREVDDVLSKSFWDLFSNTQEINLVKAALDDAQYAPVLNALEKAAEWNTQAIDDVTTFAKWIIWKKADEEYNRAAEQERIADDERSWDQADNSKRLALLQSQFKDVPIMDTFIWNPDKFKNMSYAEAVNVIQKDIEKKWDKDLLSQIYGTIVATWKDAPKWLTDIMERTWLDYEDAKLRFDRTNEKKVEAKWDTFNNDEMVKTIWWQSEVQNFDINKYTKTLNSKVAKLWKDKVLWAIEKWYKDRKIDKAKYDSLLWYINKN